MIDRMLTHGEFQKLSAAEQKSYWLQYQYGKPMPKLIYDVYYDFTPEPRRSDAQYDHDQGNAEGWGNQIHIPQSGK